MTSKSELKEELLEQVYHENCPGCKVDRDKRMQTGFPLKELIFMWVVVLCVGKFITVFQYFYSFKVRKNNKNYRFLLPG